MIQQQMSTGIAPDGKQQHTTRHLLSISDLNQDDFDLITRTDSVSEPFCQKKGVIALVFSQPSVRTVASFGMAAHQMGLSHIQIQMERPGSGPIAVHDECAHLAAIGISAIAIRCPNRLYPQDVEGIAAPVINAGDGSNEHPTQALLDIHVMKKTRGLNDKTIVMAGNCRDHRTMHSLAKALSRFPSCRIKFISSHDMLPPPEYVTSRCECIVVNTRKERNAHLSDADYLYITPPCFFNNTLNASDPDLNIFGITLQEARSFLNPSAKILHPFPRHGELDPMIDGTEFDAYSAQASAGALIRRRVLEWALKSFTGQ